MRELERIPPTVHTALPRCAVVGRGRLGTALAGALRSAGAAVDGPLGRGAGAAGAEVVLLCVPDAEIARAAASVERPAEESGRDAARDPLVGHCSGATTLEPVLAGGHEAFSLHPLMTVTTAGAPFAGAGCAVAGSSPRALALARDLAAALGMRPVEVADEDRAAYHAAASLASNFVVTLEDAAERLAASAGVSRELIAPLMRQTVENVLAVGPEHALTGPILRGDEGTVARQRAAVAERCPDLLALFDALAAVTRPLAARARAAGQTPAREDREDAA